MSSTKKISRKLSAVEQKLHQASLAAPNKTITPEDLTKLAGDASTGTAAINFLLSVGMLKAQNDSRGRLSFRAVAKGEMEQCKDMSGEESMVLSHIQAAGNEGIWTKHIKAKTELHQTVIDRCLKSLTQKQLIKSIKSVKHPTRKLYMLYHLEPSVELTGGPWYTDNELDTEFIKLLSSACLRFIKDRVGQNVFPDMLLLIASTRASRRRNIPRSHLIRSQYTRSEARPRIRRLNRYLQDMTS
ncbi:RNA polymerase Rpc34 [Punctularia strigosozonata HHB-11173 SS5]|uniref:RNA polymerase Rpc34 n=1 Tax=Punctularia strigosozonata (strain HHB-11173) TaxID=741275 RepID=UPI00044185E0|nr:RNA polymerase Rpc34 [Punctularia strigosozonata HHB-11173 SS5]EIN14515.1 RNA polymerase Rpc34 [Punctularia strigosozonata HHB-11173 SS5]